MPAWAEAGPDIDWGASRPDNGFAHSLRDRRTGIIMLLVPSGETVIGRTDSLYPDEGPERRVRISRPFYLGRTEVTLGTWKKVMGSPPPDSDGTGPEDLPVTGVSFEAIQEFLRRTGFRLPTEVEWEHAARAGRTSILTDEEIQAEAWGQPNARDQVRPVATLRPNPWGFHDLPGNVWEWCADGYDARLLEDLKDGAVDPRGPEASDRRSERGGSARDPWSRVSWTSRAAGLFTDRQEHLGFRVARDAR